MSNDQGRGFLWSLDIGHLLVIGIWSLVIPIGSYWRDSSPLRCIITPMPTRPAKRSEYDVIEPIGKRVVVRKDDNKRETKSGIVLPDSHEIPVITGRVIAISKAIENDEDQTIRQYDKVLFDPREAIPVELEHDNRLFVVHLDRVLAIFRRSDTKAE